MSDEKKCSEATCCGGCEKTPKWKRDFPIEWEGDHYVSRREMVKYLTLGSAVLTGANWVAATAGKLAHHGSKQERYIGTASVLEREGSILFRYPTDEDPCIAVRTPKGQLVAYSQVCTHLSCAVIYDKKDNSLFCPCHNGRFDVAHGEPTAGPPTRPLPRIRIEQRGDKLYALEVEA